MGMARALGQRWAARLLAAVTAVGLVLASLVGSAAHACETSRHGQHRHQSLVGSPVGSQAGHHVAARQQAAAVAASAHASHVKGTVDRHGPDAADLPETDGGDRDHACCMDFICHGCIAVIANETGSQLLSWRDVCRLPWDAQAPASVSPARLDRPPKSLASA
jgi:hypothetical protein